MAESLEQANQAVVNAISDDQTLVPYKPISKCKPMGSFTPISLATETVEALTRVEERYGDIPSYIAKSLGYASRLAVCDSFAAEQADAIASILYQFQDGNAFILADMAGIGKGRVVASILRYAYQHEKIPVFVTLKANLFSDIFRDIDDIDGLGYDGGGKTFGTPFIINGYKKDGSNSVFFNNRIAVEPPRKSVINKVVKKKGQFPKGYDWLMATYSQFTGKAGQKRRDWLESIADQCIFVFDEAHVVAGNSDLRKYFEILTISSVNTLFSSATFAKRPENMYIFAHRTDLGKSDVGVDNLLDAIQSGGNKLQEFMASTLVKSGQMIRRERSFDNCEVDYKYMAKESTNRSYEIYDEAIRRFNALVAYSITPAFKSAIASAIDRYVENFNSTYRERLAEARMIAEEDAYADNIANGMEEGDARRNARAIAQDVQVLKTIEVTHEEKPPLKDDRMMWIGRNKGKYHYKHSLGMNKVEAFRFIENLLFSIKSEDVFDQTLIQLTGRRNGRDRNLENTSTEGEVFLSERKVVIGVRDTFESVYEKLGMTEDDTLPENDFKWYFKALINNMLKGTLSFYKISPKLASTGSIGNLPAEDLVFAGDWELQQNDFADNMEKIFALTEEFTTQNIGIPLSPIDYIIQRLQSTPRPEWNKYGNGNPNYVVEEVTGRRYILADLPDGFSELQKNYKRANPAGAFEAFNDGSADVLLVNTSGSTGSSAHSKYDFRDRRPRAMIIHQPELDVNVEVQKRGRVYRTGQVNYPTYIYLVSRIPSEIRRLIMLRHKLKSLDANTTANQEQSARLSDIRSADGGIIEDFDNEVGLALLEEFLMDGSNIEFQEYMGSMFYEGERDEDGNLVPQWMKLSVNGYLRNIQFAPAATQQEFYDAMNESYISKKTEMKANNEWNIETETEDLRAVLKTRITKEKGDGRTFFGEAVYEEDDYIMKELMPLSKEKVMDLQDKLLDGQSKEQFMKTLISNVRYYFETEHMERVLATLKVPERSDYNTEEEFKQATKEYNIRKEAKKASEKQNLKELVEILQFFTPNKPVLIPADVGFFAQMADDDMVEMGNRLRFGANRGRFIGYKIKGDGKFSRGNIEMIFAQLDNEPKVTFKPTNKYLDALFWMMGAGNLPNPTDLQFIDNWEVDADRRDVARLITGNILSGYAIAQSMVKSNSDLWKGIRFSRFTTFDGNMLRVGIRLLKADPMANPILTPENAVLIANLNSEDVRKAASNLGVNNTLDNEGNNVYFKNTGMHYVEGEYRDEKFLEFTVVLGRLKTNSETEISNKSPIKKADIYDNEEVWKDAPSGVEKAIVFKRHQYMYGGIMQDKMLKLLVKKITFPDTDAGWQMIQPLLDAAYKADRIKIELKGMSGQEVFDRPDVFGTQEATTSTIDTSREYKYYPRIRFNPTNKPTEFIKHEPFETSPFNHGVVYTHSALKPIKAMSYNLLPADLTIPEMYAFYMSQLNESQQRDTIKSLEEMIAEGDSDVLLGNFAIKKLTSGLEKFVFGNLTLYQIGEVFRRYLAGEFDAEVAEQAQQPLTSEEEQMVQEYEEIASIPLSWDSAEDFMILLKHKID